MGRVVDPMLSKMEGGIRSSESVLCNVGQARDLRGRIINVA